MSKHPIQCIIYIWLASNLTTELIMTLFISSLTKFSGYLQYIAGYLWQIIIAVKALSSILKESIVNLPP